MTRTNPDDASLWVATGVFIHSLGMVMLVTICLGPHRAREDISERAVLMTILAHLGLPTFTPPIARARSPAFEGA
jgi:hypothetical protein